MNRQTGRYVDRQMDIYMLADVCIEGRRDGWTNIWTDNQPTDRQINGQIYEQTNWQILK